MDAAVLLAGAAGRGAAGAGAGGEGALMGRPIGVAWLYEQLEGAVKRELGLEVELRHCKAKQEQLEAQIADLEAALGLAERRRDEGNSRAIY